MCNLIQYTASFHKNNALQPIIERATKYEAYSTKQKEEESGNVMEFKLSVPTDNFRVEVKGGELENPEITISFQVMTDECIQVMADILTSAGYFFQQRIPILLSDDEENDS